jgi:membrane protease YdiL (CAAX protease family)
MSRLPLKNIFIFLLLTFGLTWGFEYLISISISQQGYYALGLHPLGMFFPAFSAILMQVFYISDSPVYFRKQKEPVHWIFYSFLILTVLYAIFTLFAIQTSVRPLILQGLSGILIMFWTLLLFYLYGKSGEKGFQRVGLQINNKDLSIRFIFAITLFLLSQAALNWIFGLGEFTGVQDHLAGIPISKGFYPFALVLFFLFSMIGTPLSALAVLFGEEYGWRGFLHDQISPLGNKKAALLVGLIWGIWHIPIILSGVHTYPPTTTGVILGLIFFILTGVVFAYARIKTKNIWLVVFIHGVLNSLYAFILTYLIRPDEPLKSFGLGSYGLVCLGIIVIFILRDPIWRKRIA